MKTVISACLALFFSISLYSQNKPPIDSTVKVQLCLLLDVSGSMNGLLSQAQNEIWKLIAFLEEFEKDGKDIIIEMAVLSYGNGWYDENKHIHIESPFTTAIEDVAERLLYLEPTGSNEFCGAAIQQAIDSLVWEGEQTFKCIMIAGNEDFGQGDIPYEDAMLLAKGNNILINTIYCGDYDQGIYENWQRGAILGEGEYLNIDQSISTDDFTTPYDLNLIQFYYDYKSTFFDDDFSIEDRRRKPYNSDGEVSPAFRDMIMYKFSKTRQEEDVIDRFNNNNWQIEESDKAKLPEEWQRLDENKLKFKLLEQARKRETYAEGFQNYTQKVKDFLQTTVQPVLDAKTLDLAMREILWGQLTTFGFNKK